MQNIFLQGLHPPYDPQVQRIKHETNRAKNITHTQHRQGWHKDAMSWLSQWGIQEEITIHNDDIKIIITFKFKEKLWCYKELEDKRKLYYYKEVIKPN
jgi:hypothetical protein